MNWLAHLLLSEPTPAFRIDNLLPDLVRLPALAGLGPEYQRGIRCHLRIDAFTDAHPIFRRSIQRLGPQHRRLGGILMDMFYDHFLSRQWSSFSEKPLAEFTAEIYANLRHHQDEVPQEARQPLQWMAQGDWLSSYGNTDALAKTLRRMSRRFRRPVDLAAAMPALEQQREALEHDFAEFFPQLRQHVRENWPI